MRNNNTQLLLEQPSMYNPHTPAPLVVHARDCHRLMTNPRNKAMVSFCLVDTPQDGPFEGKLVERWDNASLHNVESTVAPQKRVSTSAVFVRDKAIEQKMIERYEVANRYYQSYLEELYNK